MKKINLFFNLIISLGIFVILGTAGGSDMGTVTISEIFTFTLSGIALILVGNAGKKIAGLILTPPKKPAIIKSLPVRKRYQGNIAA